MDDSIKSMVVAQVDQHENTKNAFQGELQREISEPLKTVEQILLTEKTNQEMSKFDIGG